MKLEMLAAECGDCLWLEYGEPGDTRVVIVDGGTRGTAPVLRERIAAACRERRDGKLEVELLVVTHIDNDHILGILELLRDPPPGLQINDIWFNGRPQLVNLPARDPSQEVRSARRRGLLRIDDDDAGEGGASEDARPSPSNLLGPAEGDDLSELLKSRGLPWNEHQVWNRGAVVVPDSGGFPVAPLTGGLRLTVLGPTLDRLFDLRAAWRSVLSGADEAIEAPGRPGLLKRGDRWPPEWQEAETRDPSRANGSSILLLAEYGNTVLLLAADGHAPDLAAAVRRVLRLRSTELARLRLSAFKLPHHGSSKNLSRELLDSVDCDTFLISTDGSVHQHPDHQALLRILRYASRRPRLLFNYERATTTPWRDAKGDVVGGGFQDYDTGYPEQATNGIVVEFDEAGVGIRSSP